MTLNDALRALIDAKAQLTGRWSEDWDKVEVPEGRWTQFSVWVFIGPDGTHFDDVYLGDGR